MRRSILALMILPMFAAVASGGQLCSQEPFSESFGYSSEDFGGGSYLGVDTRDVTADRLADLKLKEEHGVEVTLVDQDAPAGKAGIKEHDVILTLNGNQVESVEQLRFGAVVERRRRALTSDTDLDRPCLRQAGVGSSGGCLRVMR